MLMVGWQIRREIHSTRNLKMERPGGKMLPANTESEMVLILDQQVLL